MSTIAIGRIVHYILTPEDAQKLNNQPDNGWIQHFSAGKIYPAMVVQVEDYAGELLPHLDVHLAGCRELFKPAIREDATDAQDTPGTWHWPPITQPKRWLPELQRPQPFTMPNDPELAAALNRIVQAKREDILAASLHIDNLAAFQKAHPDLAAGA